MHEINEPLAVIEDDGQQDFPVIITSPSAGRCEKYCDQSVCLFVCLLVYLKNTRPNFTYSRGSVLL